MNKKENLIFKGGGVLGIAYAGAIEVLEKEGVLADIKRVAGTSAGSIVSALLALKYNAVEIQEVLKATNFKDFEDHWDPLRIATKYGIYKGEKILNWIKGLIKDKTGSEETTFGELSGGDFLELKIFATDLSSASLKEFSNEKTPNTKIAEAIRASISIPIFFAAWQFPDNIPDDHIYVDGGALYNYPIEAFDDLDETIGFFLKSDESVKPLKFDHLISYVGRLFNTAMQAQTIDFMKNQQEVGVTCFIDSLGISATDFKLNDDQKQALFESGKKSAEEYLKSHAVVA